MKIYTVTIIDHCDEPCEPWVTSFSTREKAEAFKREAEARLKKFDAYDTTSVVLDYGELDDDMYLSWIDARYDLDAPAGAPD